MRRPISRDCSASLSFDLLEVVGFGVEGLGRFIFWHDIVLKASVYPNAQ